MLRRINVRDICSHFHNLTNCLTKWRLVTLIWVFYCLFSRKIWLLIFHPQLSLKWGVCRVRLLDMQCDQTGNPKPMTLWLKCMLMFWQHLFGRMSPVVTILCLSSCKRDWLRPFPQVWTSQSPDYGGNFCLCRTNLKSKPAHSRRCFNNCRKAKANPYLENQFWGMLNTFMKGEENL